MHLQAKSNGRGAWLWLAPHRISGGTERPGEAMSHAAMLKLRGEIDEILAAQGVTAASREPVMRDADQDREVTELLRAYDTTVERLRQLGVDVVSLRALDRAS